MRVAAMFKRLIGACVGLAMMGMAGTAGASDIYATSTFTGELYKIDPSGNATLFASGLGQPHEIEIDGTGTLYVAEVAG